MTASSETLDRVRQILRSSLKLEPDAELAADMPLLGGEYDLDSLDVLLVITNIEKEFGLQIRDGTMDRSAFASLGTLAGFVDRLRSGA
jgi:acyl carrier protein